MRTKKSGKLTFKQVWDSKSPAQKKAIIAKRAATRKMTIKSKLEEAAEMMRQASDAGKLQQMTQMVREAEVVRPVIKVPMPTAPTAPTMTEKKLEVILALIKLVDRML